MNYIIKIKKKVFKLLSKHLPFYKLRILLLKNCGYIIGKDVYIGEDILISDELDDRNNIIIGDRVSIASRVSFITSSAPNFSRLRPYVKTVNGVIVIKNDSWIGAGVIILPNVTIGEFAVVGAGSVITRDVPPKTIVAGVPAKVIKSLEIPNDIHSKSDISI
jgi:maltose O-acetyltransferase